MEVDICVFVETKGTGIERNRKSIHVLFWITDQAPYQQRNPKDDCPTKK
jgi:hypothetical protein